MKFLADENFPLPSVRILQGYGYDILTVIEGHPSISDEDVIELANTTDRTILTFDKDYGELIFKYGLRPRRGVFYFRIQHFSPDEPGKLLHVLLTNTTITFDSTLFVYDGNELRQRSYAN